MDKTIEIIVVAMVALIVATIVLFLVQDRTDSFSGFLGGQQEGAQCDLWKAQGEDQKYRDNGCGSYSSDSYNVRECPEGQRPAAGGCVPEGSGAGL